MGVFIARVKDLASKSAGAGNWYRYAGGGATDPTKYSGVDADLITSVRAAQSATNFIGVSQIAPGDVGWLTTPWGSVAQKIEFNLDTTNLLIDGVPTAINSLPAGFTILTATFKIGGTVSGGATDFLKDGFSVLHVDPDVGGNHSIALSVPLTILNVFTATYGVSTTNLAGGTGAVDCLVGSISANANGITVEGTWGVASTWYYNPATDHYEYVSSPPAAPWVIGTPTPTPTTVSVPGDSPVVTWVSPAFGCAGTPVRIAGSGFGDGAIVTIGGVAAISVIVVNSHEITAVTGGHADGTVDVVVTNADGVSGVLSNGYSYLMPWWIQTVTAILNGTTYTFEVWKHACTAPADGVWVLNTTLDPPPPPPTPTNVAPPFLASPNGWYVSTAAYGGSVIVLVSPQRPAAPRDWQDIGVWAAGERAMLGGSPAASCTVKNHLIYPATGYSVGTDNPPIRVFDGGFDHELCRVPSTAAGVVPQAVLSMLTANGTTYLTIHDTGTTSADWAGRVFQLDIDSGVLTPLGAPFSGGELPYALAWHMGRLWLGTTNGIGTAGKVYFIRPGIDTTWTADHDVTKGVHCLVSYGGNLYVGHDNAAGSAGLVLKRDSVGAYTTSDTGPSSTTVNNGYLQLAVFGANLYAAYWDHTSPAVAKIRKFDGSSWSTAYTGASGTIRPFVLLFTDDGVLFAAGGGMGLTAAIVTTPDGAAWSDRTAQLPESDRTILPIVGVEVL